MNETIPDAEAEQPIFVGREPELVKLKGYLNEALSGRGQIAFVTGQAGSGKTYLVHQFVRQALGAHPNLVVAAGSSDAQTGVGDPYLPFREAVGMLTGDVSGKFAREMEGENVHRLRNAFVRSVQVLVDVAPQLIGVFTPVGGLVGLAGKVVVKSTGWMDQLQAVANPKAGVGTGGAPLADQSHIFEKVADFVHHLSAEMPLVLFLDDLQWADKASIGLLFHLARHIEHDRVLIVGAYRPTDVALGRGGQRHPLAPAMHELTRYFGDIFVDLDLIPPVASRQFLEDLLDARPNSLDAGFRDTLFERTGGHALFTVELLREMEVRGDVVRDSAGRWAAGGELDWDTLPARVEGVIAERIGRLPEELRDLLTVGSVEGDTFVAEVVARVQNLDDRQAIRMLSGELERQHHLISAQGLGHHGPLQVSVYRFAHNLFQRYLYAQLTEPERAYLHRDVGEVEEALFAGDTERVAADLARHFEEGGVADKAATYRLQAGMRAWKMSAPHEATVHLTRGLDLLVDVPAARDRMQLAFELQNALGTVSLAAEGYASPRVEHAFVRAGELARALGDPAGEIPVLYGLSAFHFVRAELTKAYDEAQRLLALAREVGDEGYALGAELVMGASATHLVHFERARRHLESVVAGYDPARHRDLAQLQGHDPAVGAYSYLALVLWQQGYAEQALAASEAAVALAEELEHPYSLGYAASFAAMVRQMLRQWPESRDRGETALRLGVEGPFPSWEAIGRFTRGLSLVHQGREEEGVAAVAQGLAVWEATGAKLALPYQYTLLAEAYLVAGRKDEGLQAVDDAFGLPTDGLWWLPEQHRVRAELLLLEPADEAGAELDFRRARDSARSHGNRSAELRAATGLARLLQREGRLTEGRDLLAPLHASFTEGFELPDLREAAELLAELRAGLGDSVPLVAGQVA